MLLLSFSGAAIAQSDGCHTRCANHCSGLYSPDDPSFFVCYDECAAGCHIGPTMPTVP
jgi:hypothetical protein